MSIDHLKLVFIKAPKLPEGSAATEIEAVVKNIIGQVRENGDAAIHHFSRLFDKYESEKI